MSDNVADFCCILFRIKLVAFVILIEYSLEAEIEVTAGKSHVVINCFNPQRFAAIGANFTWNGVRLKGLLAVGAVRIFRRRKS